MGCNVSRLDDDEEMPAGLCHGRIKELKRRRRVRSVSIVSMTELLRPEDRGAVNDESVRKVIIKKAVGEECVKKVIIRKLVDDEYVEEEFPRSPSFRIYFLEAAGARDSDDDPAKTIQKIKEAKFAQEKETIQVKECKVAVKAHGRENSHDFLISNEMSKKEGKSVFKRLLSAVTGSSSTRSSSGGSYDPSDIGHSGRWSERVDSGRWSEQVDAGRWSEQVDAGRWSEQVDAGSSSIPEDPYEEVVGQCVSKSSSSECQHMPFLSEEELDTLHLPFQLQQDITSFDRNHMKARAKHSLQEEKASQLVAEAEARIAFASAEGEDLSLYRGKGRGVAEEASKVSKDGRVVLIWKNGIPVGPGKWSARFNGFIGCIAHNSQLWDISYTFTENEGCALTESWKKLLRSYILEDDMDRSYKYVRYQLGEVFKKYRNNLKTYTNSKVFQLHWQRFAGLPTNVDHDQYAHLLLYWETPEAKAVSDRASANRAKNEYGYYGGSSKATRYRHYVEETGEQAPASAAWSALHLKDNMPEGDQEAVKKQADALRGYECTWRDAHPDYPVDSSMPFEDELAMADQVFPKSKPKGKIPLIGATSLTRSKSRKATSSSAATAAPYDYVQQIQELQQRQLRETELREKYQCEMSSQFAEMRQQMGLGRMTPDQRGWDTLGSPPPVQHGQAPPPSYAQPPGQSGWGTWPSYDQPLQQPQSSQTGYQNIQMTNEEWEQYRRYRAERRD